MSDDRVLKHVINIKNNREKLSGIMFEHRAQACL